MLTFRLSIFSAALIYLSSAVGQSLPDAGGQVQQIPPVPTTERAPPEFRFQQSDAQQTLPSSDIRLLVNSLHVAGHTLFSEDELLSVTQFVPGRELSLPDLQAMASRISDHYHENGYFVAQAYIPAQEIVDGAVTIAVLEGHYGTITLRNESGLSDRRAQRILEKLNSGDTIALTPLESRLLVLSDIPGVAVSSTLAPGASVGESDLIVSLAPGRRVTGSIEADNAGNYYTGEYRAGATVNFNNVTGNGDVVSLRALTSGSGMQYGRASYQTPVGRGNVGVAYTAMNYELGEELAVLDAHGTARIASIFASYPFVRSRNSNLYLVAGFDDKRFDDRVDSTSTNTERKVRVGSLGLAGNHRDRLGGGGVTSYSVTAYSGDVDIITPQALAVDQATAQTDGGFQKVGYELARTQNVTETVSLFASLRGQFASDNLDSSEKIGLGGPYGVRGYPVGEGYMDEAHIVHVEVRKRLLLFDGGDGHLSLIVFYDAARGTINKNPWTGEDNNRTLRGAGVGLVWEDYDNYRVSVTYAERLGNESVTSIPDNSSGQWWIHGVKYF
jgi:hemolysin activation/secretion protein